MRARSPASFLKIESRSMTGMADYGNSLHDSLQHEGLALYTNGQPFPLGGLPSAAGEDLSRSRCVPSTL
jgi:hypothetical protein